MASQRTEIVKRLEQLCHQASSETDPQKRTRLTAEIYRLVEEKNQTPVDADPAHSGE
jgi:hypothetical protein